MLMNTNQLQTCTMWDTASRSAGCAAARLIRGRERHEKLTLSGWQQPVT